MQLNNKFLHLMTLLFIVFAHNFLFAQVVTKTGEIYGQVIDPQSVPLHGVTILVQSETIVSQSLTTGSNGGFRFANLPPGMYSVQFSLSGFTQIRNDEVRVTIGGSSELKTILNPTITEELLVIADSSLLDRKDTGISYIYTEEYLSQIPNGRTPWFILNQTPGISTSHLDTGAQPVFQPTFLARGGSRENTIWNYDGINQTDSVAIGSPSNFFDFEAFEEIQISTGGNDASIQTGGIAINMVTKRPGNKWDGDASFYRSGETLDYGFQAGGPLVKDKLFVWAAYRLLDDSSHPEIFIRESTTLRDYNLKLNYNWSRTHATHVGYFKGYKEMLGRDSWGNTAPEALIDQGNSNAKGNLTAEHTWIPNDHFLMNIRYGFLGSAFDLRARGGTDRPVIILWPIGRLENTYFTADVKRPAHDLNVEANYFTEKLLGGDHEFKFGFEYKTAHPSTLSSYGNGMVINDFYQTVPQGPLIAGYLYAQHPSNSKISRESIAFHFTDTFRRNRFTLNLGLRFDHQSGRNDPSSVPAVTTFEEFVGPFDYPGGNPKIGTNDLSPRLGATYDLTNDGKTLLRGNYARYYDAFNPQFLMHSNPTSVYNGAIFLYTNQNGDRNITPNETDLLGYYGGLNGSAFDLNSFLAQRKYDSHLSNAWTNELILGIERELTKDFSVSADFSYRRYGNFLRVLPFGVSTGDYVSGGTFTATTPLGDFSIPYFTLPHEHDGTAILKNIKDYQQSYRGLDVAVHKRMSKNFLLNGSFNLQRQTGHYNGGDSLAIETQSSTSSGASYPYDPTNLPFLQNQPYVLAGGNANAGVYPYSDWSFKASGIYMFPWEVSIGTFLRYQQGYPFVLMGLVDDQSLFLFYRTRGHRILLEPIGSRRYDNIFTIDLQLQKTLSVGNFGHMTVLLTIFNLTNEDTVTVRRRFVESPDFNEVAEQLSPRSYRFGFRYQF